MYNVHKCMIVHIHVCDTYMYIHTLYNCRCAHTTKVGHCLATNCRLCDGCRWSWCKLIMKYRVMGQQNSSKTFIGKHPTIYMYMYVACVNNQVTPANYLHPNYHILQYMYTCTFSHASNNINCRTRVRLSTIMYILLVMETLVPAAQFMRM